jgi:hypothetical protein
VIVTAVPTGPDAGAKPVMVGILLGGDAVATDPAKQPSTTTAAAAPSTARTTSVFRSLRAVRPSIRIVETTRACLARVVTRSTHLGCQWALTVRRRGRVEIRGSWLSGIPGPAGPDGRGALARRVSPSRPTS